MKLKLCFLLVFMISYSWSQSGSTKTFTGNGTFPVPAGVSSIQVQAWGGGGSGGGASGAPLLLGRGAAGGGGGAYASSTLLVTSGTTLNVVVASQTAGTTGVGLTGGSSTITGFESAILAAGGSGGEANNAGGSPVGGAGGTIAASAGSIRFAGSNGGNGNSWNLLGILLSSGTGGAGASSGGAGGTAVSGLLLSNAPGNAGSPPGGAGSGAINSALGAAQIGGAGAAGRIIISYSCANFSLTSTAASAVCISSGSTSTVSLTGSASSLPVGNYMVTYNRSSPSATALTANLTVSTAGTGTFTATGLTTAGSSIITITKLTSESCSSNITTNNTATVTISPATIAGTVNGGTTVCSGSPSGLLTLSGNTGSVVKWQSSVSPFTTWTDIANTVPTYTSGVLTETTQFRAIIQSGTCAVAYSAETTVTISPATAGGTVSGGTAVSLGSTSGLLTLSGHTGSIVKWQSSVSPFSTWTDIANTNTGYISGPLTETTLFRAVVQSGSCAVVNSAATTVTVIALPTITLATSAADLCVKSGGNINLGGQTTLSYSATTGSPLTYSIAWNPSPTNNLTAINNATLPASPITITVPIGTAAGTYTGTLTVKDANGFVSNPGSVFTLKINQGITISTSGTITPVNASSNPQTTVLYYNATTGTPNKYSIDWTSPLFADQGATSNYFYGTGYMIQNIQVPADVPAGTYTGTIIISNDYCSESKQVSITINPAPLPTITTAASANAVCSSVDSQTTTLAYTATTGNPVSYSIVWDASPANNFVEVIDALLPASPITIAIPAGTTAGTYAGTLTVKDANGVVSSGSLFNLTINETPTINIGFGSIYEVTISPSMQNTTLNYFATSGNPTSYSIDWNDTANASSLQDQPSTPYAFTVNGGSINTIEVSGFAKPGIYTGTMYISNGTCSDSVTVTLEIKDIEPTIDLATSANAVCSSIDSQTTTLAYTATTGNPVSYSIVWDASPANTFAAVTDEPLPASPITIAIPAGTTAGSYVGTLTVKNANGAISSGSLFNLTINETPSITTTGIINSVYTSSSVQYASLEYTAVTGNPTSYTIDWDAAANAASLSDQPFNIPFAFEPNGGILNIIRIPANVPPGTYSGIITIGNEYCNTSHSISIKVNPVVVPTITIEDKVIACIYDLNWGG